MGGAWKTVGVRVTTFWLLDRGGNDLGMLRTDSHVWRRGERLSARDGRALQVVEAVPAA
jgi:hypothetical protein